MAGVETVRIGEEDEAVSVAVELLHDFPHRFVEGEDVEPGFGEDFGSDLISEDGDRAGDEFFIGHGSGFEGVLEFVESGREGGLRVSDDFAVEVFEVKLEEDVADVEEESHGAGIFERMILAASRAAAGFA